jgi:Flp pilus assembly protein TadG
MIGTGTMEDDKTISCQKGRGQTVIETVLMLLFLLVLFFMIAEFARAWYLKNSLNNAARVGVRVAIVTPDLAEIAETPCYAASGAVLNAVCDSPGLSNMTEVTVSVADDVPPALGNNNGFASTGDTIKVGLKSDFETIIPIMQNLVPESAASEASMRYE